MSLLQRLGHLIREDLAAILPGSNVGLNRETGLRLVPYAALLFFVLGLLFPGVFAPGQGVIRVPAPGSSSPREQSPPLTEPEPPTDRDDVRDSESI